MGGGVGGGRFRVACVSEGGEGELVSVASRRAWALVVVESLFVFVGMMRRPPRSALFREASGVGSEA